MMSSPTHIVITNRISKWKCQRFAKNADSLSKVLGTIITLIEELKFQFNFVIWDFLFIKILSRETLGLIHVRNSLLPDWWLIDVCTEYLSLSIPCDSQIVSGWRCWYICLSPITSTHHWLLYDVMTWPPLGVNNSN